MLCSIYKKFLNLRLWNYFALKKLNTHYVYYKSAAIFTLVTENS